MFDYLSDVGRSLRGELVSTYWVLIVPLVLLLIVMEFLKNDEPDVKDIFRRVLVSMILLYSFDTTLNGIATIGDSITDKIDGLQKLWDVLKNLGPNYNSASNDWFNLRETALYIFNIGAYIIAYLGFFISNAMIHFVWTILFVCSPLMILAYVARQTEHVTFSTVSTAIINQSSLNERQQNQATNKQKLTLIRSTVQVGKYFKR